MVQKLIHRQVFVFFFRSIVEVRCVFADTVNYIAPKKTPVPSRVYISTVKNKVVNAYKLLTNV